jgi:hypothetical protein
VTLRFGHARIRLDPVAPLFELELLPQHAQRHPAVLLQVAPHVADDVEEIHGVDSESRQPTRCACSGAPRVE